MAYQKKFQQGWHSFVFKSNYWAIIYEEQHNYELQIMHSYHNVWDIVFIACGTALLHFIYKS